MTTGYGRLRKSGIWALDFGPEAFGPGTFSAGVPSSLGCGVGRQSYSNFLASTVLSMNFWATLGSSGL